MSANLTDLTIILDRSGSMQGTRDDMEGALKALLADQASHPGELRVSLVRFDDVAEPVFTALPVATVRTIRIDPRGCTALLDAVGHTIDQTGQRLGAMPESDRPGAVMMAIVTDGLENASRRFGWKDVHQRIVHQAKAYNWQFIFLGTNIDAIATAGQLGIARGDAMTFANDQAGTHDAVAAASKGMRRKREALAMFQSQCDEIPEAFTSVDRDRQKRD